MRHIVFYFRFQALLHEPFLRGVGDTGCFLEGGGPSGWLYKRKEAVRITDSLFQNPIKIGSSYFLLRLP